MNKPCCPKCGRASRAAKTCRVCRNAEALARRGPSVCHPTRAAFRAGYCYTCYLAGLVPRAKCHPNRPEKQDGLCRQCMPQPAERYRLRVIKNRCRQYGIDWRVYFHLIEVQGGEICAICAAPATCIDHDHATGLVRGLLCTRCNYGLGNFRDDTEVMRNAITYLGSNFTHTGSSVLSVLPHDKWYQPI